MSQKSRFTMVVEYDTEFTNVAQEVEKITDTLALQKHSTVVTVKPGDNESETLVPQCREDFE